MKIEFENAELERLATDVHYAMGLDAGVVKKFRMAMQAIAAAEDERIFQTRPGWNFEKLKGDLRGKCSIRLNKQWRLLFRFEKREDSKVVVIISIVDYH